MSENTKMDVIVHKSINLVAGETLHDFTSALHTDAKEHVKRKLNLPGPRPGKSYPGWSCYVAEIFSASVVVSLYKDDMAGGNKYYAFSFDRDAKTKKFTFGDTTEVERFTGFRAKPATTMLTKDAVGIQKRGGDGAFAVTEVHALKSADGALWAPTAARELELSERPRIQ